MIFSNDFSSSLMSFEVQFLKNDNLLLLWHFGLKRSFRINPSFHIIKDLSYMNEKAHLTSSLPLLVPILTSSSPCSVKKRSHLFNSIFLIDWRSVKFNSIWAVSQHPRVQTSSTYNLTSKAPPWESVLTSLFFQPVLPHELISLLNYHTSKLSLARTKKCFFFDFYLFLFLFFYLWLVDT